MIFVCVKACDTKVSFVESAHQRVEQEVHLTRRISLEKNTDARDPRET